MEARRVACERTSQFVSLELDGELSLLERAILARHLQKCPRCTADAAMIRSLTLRLRAAPLERLPSPIIVLRPRRRVGRLARSAFATAAVAVVGMWFGIASSERAHAPVTVVTPHLNHTVAAASDGRYDWPAGLPRSPHLVQLVPGGLYTSSVVY
jgi:anti-sigma factor RsiW